MQQGLCRLLTFCVGDFSLCLYAVDHGSRQRMRSRHAKAAATSQTVATARASERRNGPCRVNTPRSPTGDRRRQGPGSGCCVRAARASPAAHRGADRRLSTRSSPLLHDPVPQTVDSVVKVLHFFLQRWPVGAEQVWNCEARQVIDVPKISPDQTLQRLEDSLRQPQTAEQLVRSAWVRVRLRQAH